MKTISFELECGHWSDRFDTNVAGARRREGVALCRICESKQPLKGEPGPAPALPEIPNEKWVHWQDDGLVLWQCRVCPKSQGHRIQSKPYKSVEALEASWLRHRDQVRHISALKRRRESDALKAQVDRALQVRSSSGE